MFIFWLSTVGIAWYLHVGDLAGAAVAWHHVASKHPSLGTRQATPAHSSHTHQLPSLSVHAIMLNHHCHPTALQLVETVPIRAAAVVVQSHKSEYQTTGTLHVASVTNTEPLMCCWVTRRHLQGLSIIFALWRVSYAAI